MIIKIKNLRVTTSIGIYDWEKNFARDIIINAKITTDHRDSLISDNINDTIDYDSIIGRIKDVISNNQFKLIEKLTQEILDAIMSDQRVVECTVEVDKVKVFEDLDSLSVTLTGKRDG